MLFWGKIQWIVFFHDFILGCQIVDQNVTRFYTFNQTLSTGLVLLIFEYGTFAMKMYCKNELIFGCSDVYKLLGFHVTIICMHSKLFLNSLHTLICQNKCDFNHIYKLSWYFMKNLCKKVLNFFIFLCCYLCIMYWYTCTYLVIMTGRVRENIFSMNVRGLNDKNKRAQVIFVAW